MAVLHTSGLLGFLISIIVHVHGSELGELRDYCNMEIFNATCKENEVVLLTSGRYGRMNLGRCVTGNYGYLGCAVDVLSYLDTICSGRRKCSFKVPDDVLYDSHPCPGDFTSYLEVSYKCVRVEMRNRAHCHSHNVLKVSSASGYLSSTVTEEHNLGSIDCPWVIEALPGQRINITLLNFARNSDLVTSHDIITDYNRPNMEVCFELAGISDAVEKKVVTVCGGSKRETIAYISKTNVAEVQIKHRKLLKSIGAFLLRYEVIGCPDVRTPHDTYSRRRGDTLMVKCNSSAEVWYLTCRGNHWVGDTGNCTGVNVISEPELWSLGHFFNSDEAFPYGILIIVAIGVALGVFFGGILLALIVIYSKRRLGFNKNSGMYSDVKIQPPPSDHFHTIRRNPVHDWIQDAQYSDEGIERDLRYGSRSPPLDQHTMEPLVEDTMSTMENQHAVLTEPDLVDVSGTSTNTSTTVAAHQSPHTFHSTGVAPVRIRPHIYESPSLST